MSTCSDSSRTCSLRPLERDLSGAGRLKLDAFLDGGEKRVDLAEVARDERGRGS
jgi:hypothetical protein